MLHMATLCSVPHRIHLDDVTFCRAMLCSLPQPLVAVPSFMFVNAFKAMLPLALGFAAGCMVWMVFAELMPDALDAAAHGKV